MGDVDAGATESTIEAAENRLSQRFPDDYRTFLKSKNGLEKWYGDVYLSLSTQSTKWSSSTRFTGISRISRN